MSMPFQEMKVSFPADGRATLKDRLEHLQKFACIVSFPASGRATLKDDVGLPTLRAELGFIPCRWPGYVEGSARSIVNMTTCVSFSACAGLR